MRGGVEHVKAILLTSVAKVVMTYTINGWDGMINLCCLVNTFIRCDNCGGKWCTDCYTIEARSGAHPLHECRALKVTLQLRYFTYEADDVIVMSSRRPGELDD